MASGGQVTLRGRFSPGTNVTLVRVAHAGVLRAEGGVEVDTATVDKDGVVQFKSGVEVGARYFIVGQQDGGPLEVRVRGRSAEDDAGVLAQAPVAPDRVRLSDGSFVDEPPTKESAPHVLAGHASQRHVPKGTVQRSDTPRGTAHPFDPEEAAPYRSQADVGKGVVQASDTPGYEDPTSGRKIHGGRAAEIPVGPQRQEDVPSGVVQRSATPTGVATPIPSGDAIAQQQQRESSRAKEARGDWTRAAAEPLDVKGAKVASPVGASERESAKRHDELRRSEREAAAAPVALDQPAARRADTSGRDAQGQPAAADAARAGGVEPADSPAEPVRRQRKSSSGGSRSRSTKASKE